MHRVRVPQNGRHGAQAFGAHPFHKQGRTLVVGVLPPVPASDGALTDQAGNPSSSLGLETPVQTHTDKDRAGMLSDGGAGGQRPVQGEQLKRKLNAVKDVAFRGAAI